jgi:hypothetical protein
VIKKGPCIPEFGLNWVVDEMRDGLMDYSQSAPMIISATQRDI